MYSLLICLGGSSVCFGSIATSKLSVSVYKRNNRNKLFLNKPKKTRKKLKKPKKPKKPKIFCKKLQNMLPIKLFQLVFCLFRFNRNIETLCFGTEAKQPKRFVSDSAETSFGSSFGCFDSKLVSQGHPTSNAQMANLRRQLITSTAQYLRV